MWSNPTVAVNIDAVPRQVEVFVDEYLAGTAGKVRTTPGDRTDRQGGSA